MLRTIVSNNDFEIHHNCQVTVKYDKCSPYLPLYFKMHFHFSKNFLYNEVVLSEIVFSEIQISRSLLEVIYWQGREVLLIKLASIFVQRLDKNY